MLPMIISIGLFSLMLLVFFKCLVMHYSVLIFMSEKLHMLVILNSNLQIVKVDFIHSYPSQETRTIGTSIFSVL